MKNIVLAALSAFVIALSPVGAHADDRPLTVIELYTSQDCRSCPPADTFLGELKERERILALSIHVDYWDYIGWKDPYALPQNTQRQRSYARNLGLGYVYTPQIVVQGMAHTTGSNKGHVERLIRDLQGLKRLNVSATRGGDSVEITVPGGTFNEEARILLVGFDAEHVTDIRRGENAGKKLSYHNVVRVMEQVGTWEGAPVSLSVDKATVDLTGRDGAAVLVQSVRTGRILGAAKLGLGPTT